MPKKFVIFISPPLPIASLFEIQFSKMRADVEVAKSLKQINMGPKKEKKNIVKNVFKSLTRGRRGTKG